MFKWITKHFFKKKQEVVIAPTCNIERLRKLAGINDTKANDDFTSEFELISDKQRKRAKEISDELKSLSPDARARYAKDVNAYYDSMKPKCSVAVCNKDGSTDVMIVSNFNEDLMGVISCSLAPPVDRIDHMKQHLAATTLEQSNVAGSNYE
jgi:hypothetical protein